jgi:hypothetical protein
MSQQLPPQDPEEARQDFMAALAASRELGPEMDKALVDSYMEKHHKQSGPRQTGLAPQTAQVPATGAMNGALILTGLALAAYIVLLIVSGGSYWWMFWLPMAVGGWAASEFGGSGGRHAERAEYRRARYDYRRQRLEERMQRRAVRHGYPLPQQPGTPPTVEQPRDAQSSQQQ